MNAPTLDVCLSEFAADGDPGHFEIAATIRLLADTAFDVRQAIEDGALGGSFAAACSTENAGGDVQKDLDLYADNLFLGAARRAQLDHYASEELDEPVALANGCGLSIAIDPLDGSSNIDTNVSIGTIFSLLPSAADAERTFFQPGHRQLAAGFFIYGPQLALALTLGYGTSIFVYAPKRGTFVEAYKAIVIPSETGEFAVNASNYRHWDDAVQLYVDDCVKGSDGPCGKDYNMRWIASLVAEAYRILVRGGAFLYPGDGRKGYRHGRLRLVYEANPIAMLVEQAGGAATDGTKRILDLKPTDLHQRTPLIFGSTREVGTITRYHTDPSAIGTRDPLFGKRGLLRV